jgi:hypothetical protein
MILFIAG